MTTHTKGSRARKPAIHSVQPLLYRVPEAVQLLGHSRSVIFELLRSGRLKSVTEGRTRLIPAWAIQEYVDTLSKEAANGHA
jgi:excisionase family DNA binding protein